MDAEHTVGYGHAMSQVDQAGSSGSVGGGRTKTGDSVVCVRNCANSRRGSALLGQTIETRVDGQRSDVDFLANKIWLTVWTMGTESVDTIQITCGDNRVRTTHKTKGWPAKHFPR